MPGPEFWQTMMGRRLIEGLAPKFVSEIVKLNQNLEKLVCVLEEAVQERKSQETK